MRLSPVSYLLSAIPLPLLPVSCFDNCLNCATWSHCPPPWLCRFWRKQLCVVRSYMKRPKTSFVTRSHPISQLVELSAAAYSTDYAPRWIIWSAEGTAASSAARALASLSVLAFRNHLRNGCDDALPLRASAACCGFRQSVHAPKATVICPAPPPGRLDGCWIARVRGEGGRRARRLTGQPFEVALALEELGGDSESTASKASICPISLLMTGLWQLIVSSDG